MILTLIARDLKKKEKEKKSQLIYNKGAETDW